MSELSIQGDGLPTGDYDAIQLLGNACAGFKCFNCILHASHPSPGHVQASLLGACLLVK